MFITCLLIASLFHVTIAQGPIFNRGGFVCSSTQSNPPSTGFCNNPPAAGVNFNLLSGTWYVTHTSGAAGQAPNRDCATVQYTFNPSGTVSIRECSGAGPSCTNGMLSQRPGQTEPGKLVTTSDFKAYTIAAVLSTPELGYVGLVIYRCDGGRQGYTVLTKSTAFSGGILYVLRQQLLCKGYNVSGAFEGVVHGGRCLYDFTPPADNGPSFSGVIPL